MIVSESIENLSAVVADAIRREPLARDCTEAQIEKFGRVIELLVAGQSRMNLTAIRDPEAMARYHVADSLALLYAVKQYPVAKPINSAADIGTGAGFPLAPMAIVWPDTQWIGIESVGKKAKFVTETAKELSLANVTALAERAEDVAQGDSREAFDLVTSRAVGPVASLLECGLPLLSRGGRIYLFKTQASIAEWKACEKIIAELGGMAVGEFAYSLEGDEQQRVIFVAEKIRKTDSKYPRRAGVPFHDPLVSV